MEKYQWNYHSYLNLLRGILKVMEEDWQKSAQDLGITQAEQHILWILYMESQATMTKIADIGLWDLSTVMQIIKRLREKKLVKIEKNENDLRVSYVSLTNKGEEIRRVTAEQPHQLLNFIEQYGNNSDEHMQELEDFHRFLEEINLQFHGKEFVDWVKKTK
ncbi:MarR family protease production transcriptional regulator HPr [Salibacterium salarium]|uniref:MarR family winged helix-turn-helix transcriptional regulator n=1 Tax=Salibacterium salarium TaxID=284579 RepID=UPI00277FB404|nr:MarR family transcriptional regulator [Salibacterium salarium]MDQ0299551.1 MarR family protease production transcriptional regulator HPr [Salibacterium salarium]